jgi:von Willebrand factor type A domain
MRALVQASLLATLALGCGAKTGLLVPDVELRDATEVVDALDAPDVVDAPDAFDAPDVCAPRSLPFERLSAEVIFAIDRSGSMGERTPSGITRWSAVTTALASVLPSVDRELWVGLIQFPGAITAENQCGDNSRVELTPRSMNAARVLTALRSTTPSGGTPTFDALQTAANYYRTSTPVGRVRGRYLVLATDGGPNCNPILGGPSCVCTSPRGCGGPRGNLSCLDDARTIALITRLANDGVPTFLIGTPGADVAALSPTLERMALAGGRPRRIPGEPAYYRAEDVGEFTTAFRTITTELVRCRYVTNPLADPTRLSVVVAGREVPRDAARLDGWDWADARSGEILLSGAACEAAQRPDGVVSLRERCRD